MKSYVYSIIILVLVIYMVYPPTYSAGVTRLYNCNNTEILSSLSENDIPTYENICGKLYGYDHHYEPIQLEEKRKVPLISYENVKIVTRTYPTSVVHI